MRSPQLECVRADEIVCWPHTEGTDKQDDPEHDVPFANPNTFAKRGGAIIGAWYGVGLQS